MVCLFRLGVPVPHRELTWSHQHNSRNDGVFTFMSGYKAASRCLDGSTSIYHRSAKNCMFTIKLNPGSPSRDTPTGNENSIFLQVEVMDSNTLDEKKFHHSPGIQCSNQTLLKYGLPFQKEQGGDLPSQTR